MATTVRSFMTVALSALAAVFLNSASATAQTYESGMDPTGRLLQANDGYLYGTTSSGGANGLGTVFRLDLEGNAVAVHSFGDIDGANPAAGLIQANDGFFYGTTTAGGTHNRGVVFRMDPSFHVTVMHSFEGPDGASPYAPVVQSFDGNIYGTTPYGGAADLGTIFRIDPAGEFTSLYSFKGEDGEDGAMPFGGLLGGNPLVGTTIAGGYDGNGVVFAYDTSSGSLDIYHSFLGYYGDGALPMAGLTDGIDGAYGVTQFGGEYGCGTVFRVDLSPVITIHSFERNVDGCEPTADLVLAYGDLYGTTLSGGPNGTPDGAPTMFRVDGSGAVTTVHIFENSEGGTPSGPLILGSDGNLYGTATGGGAYGYGAVFRTELSGDTIALYSFGAPEVLPPTVTGFTPGSGVPGTTVVITGTNFDTATAVAFTTASTTAFTINSPTQITVNVPAGASTGRIKVTNAAGPGYSAGVFLVPPTITSFLPTSGRAGTQVSIYGHNFAGATSVTINGVAANFTIKSPTKITAGVPSGATSGKIAVTTPDGTATSATNFMVLPAITSFTPTTGPINTTVTINGTGFAGVSSVKFNGKAASFNVLSSTQLTAKVAAGSTTGKITVTTPAGTATSATNFIVLLPPTVTGFTPGSGGPGTTVVITGTNFDTASAVAFTTASTTAFTINSATQIMVNVPSGASTGRIKVTNAVGVAFSAGIFLVPPTITSFSPTSGPAGTQVTIYGTKFLNATSVTINGVAADFTINSSTKITATVPSGATSGKIAVTTPGGTATSATNFTVLP